MEPRQNSVKNALNRLRSESFLDYAADRSSNRSEQRRIGTVSAASTRIAVGILRRIAWKEPLRIEQDGGANGTALKAPENNECHAAEISVAVLQTPIMSPGISV